MSVSNLGELVNSLYAILEPYDSEMRGKAVHAVQILLGDPVPADRMKSPAASTQSIGANHSPEDNLNLSGNAAEFFDRKAPTSKLEELAVAVRFLELKFGNDSITRSDIEDVINGARRNFDGNNFRRDIDNAKTKGLFTKSRDKGVFTLSHFGQKYVDTLPNRDALGQLAKPTGARKRKSRAMRTPKKVSAKT